MGIDVVLEIELDFPAGAGVCDSDKGGHVASRRLADKRTVIKFGKTKCFICLVNPKK